MRGLTLKENCSDLRNSKVSDVIKELVEFGCDVYVHEPIAKPEEALHEYGVKLVDWDDLPLNACAIVAAVLHSQYMTLPLKQITNKLSKGGLFVDVKSAYDKQAVLDSGATLWRL